MRFPVLKSADDLAAFVSEIGFLPFFKNPIVGFSVEECTPRQLWFTDEEGPWEWKGPAIRKARCAYGKFYRGKAVYISREFFPDFANYRRDGYDFDARLDEGLARGRDVPVMRTLFQTPSLLSKELKARACVSKESRAAFDAVMTHLQMTGYVNIEDFEYARDKTGKPYGWGLARYTTPEAFFGEAFSGRVYLKQPAEARRDLERYLCGLLPQASLTQIADFLGDPA